ncbi:MAG: hypothetical protein LPK25_16935 [Cyclobacteriaceae bacterium]|nr:hypothetical protein [Cyclobacteriaceae bacterium]MDX5468038.1 hypothetical protein [Cyclobacteriaceae bacterium]
MKSLKLSVVRCPMSDVGCPMSVVSCGLSPVDGTFEVGYFLLNPVGVELLVTPGEEELPAPILIGDETRGLRVTGVLGAGTGSWIGYEYGLPAQWRRIKELFMDKFKLGEWR